MTAQDARVLIVEDDVLSSFMMEELCIALGITAEVVNSGEACLATLARRPMDFDLVLMDIHMPELSGAEAIQEIRKAHYHPPRDIPIVALTADQRWASVKLREEHGINGYLAKPVSPDALMSVCATATHS